MEHKIQSKINNVSFDRINIVYKMCKYYTSTFDHRHDTHVPIPVSDYYKKILLINKHT